MSDHLEKQIAEFNFGGPLSEQELREIERDNNNGWDGGSRFDECPRAIRLLIAQIEHLKRSCIMSIEDEGVIHG